MAEWLIKTHMFRLMVMVNYLLRDGGKDRLMAIIYLCNHLLAVNDG